MNIIISLRGGGFHSYELGAHNTEVGEGVLQVHDAKTGAIVAAYAAGEWSRLEFDRLGIGQPRQTQHVWNDIDD